MTSTNEVTNSVIKKRKYDPALIPKKDENTFLEIIRGLRDNIRLLADNTLELNAHLEERAKQDEEDMKLIRLLVENQQKNYEKVLDWALRIGMAATTVAMGSKLAGLW